MDEHQHEAEQLLEDAPAPAVAAPREVLPVRHRVGVALGGVEARAPQYAYRAVTVVNETTSTLWVSDIAGQAAEARESAGEDAGALRVPPLRALTAPIAGRELYLAATGAGTARLTVYRWPTPQPFASHELGTLADRAERAFADVAAGVTDQIIVAGVPGRRIAAIQAIAIAGGVATTLRFKSKGAGAGTAISPLFNNGVASGEVLPYSPAGWVVTAIGEALAVDTGAGSDTGVLLAYALID